MLIENYDGVPPSQSELQGWAEDYGQTFPVLSDADPAMLRFSIREDLSLPLHVLISPGGVVEIRQRDVSEEAIQAALPGS